MQTQKLSVPLGQYQQWPAKPKVWDKTPHQNVLRQYNAFHVEKWGINQVIVDLVQNYDMIVARNMVISKLFVYKRSRPRHVLPHNLPLQQTHTQL